MEKTLLQVVTGGHNPPLVLCGKQRHWSVRSDKTPYVFLDDLNVDYPKDMNTNTIWTHFM
jgi:hypothetical protein